MLKPKDIRRIREKRGMSQTDFSAVMGIHRITLVDYENGTGNPSRMAERFLELIDLVDEATFARFTEGGRR